MSLIRLIPKFFIIILSITFALMFFFIIDFIFHIIKFDKTSNNHFNILDNGFYELNKSYYGFSKFYQNTYAIKTDKNGFRVNHNQKFITDKSNYIFLGDSFVFGINGDWDEIFVGIFESAINEKVINAGTGSYSPTVYKYQYQKALKNQSLNKRHNVIIGIDISDVQDEAGFWQDGDEHPIKMPYTKEYLDSKFQKNLLSKSKKYFSEKLLWTKLVYRFLRSILNPNSLQPIENINRSAFTYKEWNLLEKEYAAPDQQGYKPLGVEGGLNKITTKIKEIKILAEKENAKLYFLIYPWPAQLVHEDKFSWEKYISNLCYETKCDGIINLFPEMKKIYKEKSNISSIYQLGDVHFNKFGNQIIANKIYEYFFNLK